jgi:hypothetical protein
MLCHGQEFNGDAISFEFQSGAISVRKLANLALFNGFLER